MPGLPHRSTPLLHVSTENAAFQFQRRQRKQAWEKSAKRSKLSVGMAFVFEKYLSARALMSVPGTSEAM